MYDDYDCYGDYDMFADDYNVWEKNQLCLDRETDVNDPCETCNRAEDCSKLGYFICEEEWE